MIFSKNPQIRDQQANFVKAEAKGQAAQPAPPSATLEAGSPESSAQGLSPSEAALLGKTGGAPVGRTVRREMAETLGLNHLPQKHQNKILKSGAIFPKGIGQLNPQAAHALVTETLGRDFVSGLQWKPEHALTPDHLQVTRRAMALKGQMMKDLPEELHHLGLQYMVERMGSRNPAFQYTLNMKSPQAKAAVRQGLGVMAAFRWSFLGEKARIRVYHRALGKEAKRTVEELIQRDKGIPGQKKKRNRKELLASIAHSGRHHQMSAAHFANPRHLKDPDQRKSYKTVGMCALGATVLASAGGIFLAIKAKKKPQPAAHPDNVRQFPGGQERAA